MYVNTQCIYEYIQALYSVYIGISRHYLNVYMSIYTHMSIHILIYTPYSNVHSVYIQCIYKYIQAL